MKTTYLTIYLILGLVYLYKTTYQGKLYNKTINNMKADLSHCIDYFEGKIKGTVITIIVVLIENIAKVIFFPYLLGRKIFKKREN